MKSTSASVNASAALLEKDLEVSMSPNILVAAAAASRLHPFSGFSCRSCKPTSSAACRGNASSQKLGNSLSACLCLKGSYPASDSLDDILAFPYQFS